MPSPPIFSAKFSAVSSTVAMLFSSDPSWRPRVCTVITRYPLPAFPTDLRDDGDVAATERPVFVFDGDCAFCSSCARFIERRIRPSADVEAWQFTDLDALGLTEDQVS